MIPNFAVLMPVEEQLQHCFSANRPGWVDEVQPGDVLVVGRNFGVGSARNIGAIFHGLGISGIVAESFNGLGLRNCVNSGMPSLPCAGVLDAFDEGDVAEVDWTTGAVRNATTGTSCRGARSRSRSSRSCSAVASRACSAARATLPRRTRHR